MSNTLINITENGTTTLATSGKYCDRNIDVVVNVAGGGGGGGFELPTEMDLYSGSYWASYGAWDWYLEAVPHLDITVSGYGDCRYMFSQCKLTDLSHIHVTAEADTNTNYLFQGCTNLEVLPTIDWKYTVNLFGSDYIGYMFAACYNLRNIPADFFKMTDENGNKTDEFRFSGKQGNGTDVFSACHSLRKLPDLPKTWYFNNQQNVYSGCYCLDELTNIPVTTYTLTSNKFSNTFSNVHRVKNITFAVKDDGTPFTVQWKSQVIDLSYGTGYAVDSVRIVENNSGLTYDNHAYDEAHYHALKNTEDWWTGHKEYSRYNHDSAVATINSLPDTSAYGTNTIKFKGDSGSATDGGAINTLTEAEIAVATAKGWTVTLV
jgi:hypothetical protein